MTDEEKGKQFEDLRIASSDQAMRVAEAYMRTLAMP